MTYIFFRWKYLCASLILEQKLHGSGTKIALLSFFKYWSFTFNPPHLFWCLFSPSVWFIFLADFTYKQLSLKHVFSCLLKPHHSECNNSLKTVFVCRNLPALYSLPVSRHFDLFPKTLPITLKQYNCRLTNNPLDNCPSQFYLSQQSRKIFLCTM